MEEKTATPYPLRTEIECDLASEPASEYRKAIVYQGTTINKAIVDYYACNTNKDRVAILQWIVERTEFQELRRFSTNENAVYGLNISQYDDILLSGEMPNNLAIAQKLVTNKFDVFLLSNPNSTKSADFILRKNNLLYYAEGKTLNGKNSLDHLIAKGCQQSNTIVIDIIGTSKINYLKKEIKKAFETYPLQEIFLLKGGRLIKIDNLTANAKHFEDYFARHWLQQK